MSLILKPDIAPYHASMLTLVMALATTRAIREISGITVGIKWPNDLVVEGKKICGILTEMSADPDQINHIVIGVGINVGCMDFSEEIRVVATSIAEHTQTEFSRADLIARILFQFEAVYDTFIQTEDLSGLMEEYNALLLNCDKEVKILDPKGSYEALALGINEQGELLVWVEDELRKITAGEVSVRGIYGYV